MAIICGILAALLATRPRAGTPVTGQPPLSRRTPGKALDRVGAADPHRRAIGRARVAGAARRVRWATDPVTLQRLIDGLRAQSPARFSERRG